MTAWEIRIVGPIGPVARSCLPGFTTTTLPPGSVVAGTVACPDELLRVIDVLTGHGAPPIDIWVTSDESS